MYLTDFSYKCYRFLNLSQPRDLIDFSGLIVRPAVIGRRWVGKLNESLYRCYRIASEESHLVPRRDEDPRRIEVGELRKVRPDIAGGFPQNERIQALSVEDPSRPTVVHIGPEWRHHPSVPGNRKSYGCELRHLSQERYKAIVVNLKEREDWSYSRLSG